ncbi:MAG: bifunctional riboflavin kinase/FMN adenylyltransferase [Phycisphaerae bacterium]|nr:bifunctional riboflavin kinase/FMN adenylyltransferase [Phycisphaerae bacterium]
MNRPTPRFLRRLNEFQASEAGSIVTIGNFDGVHLGHQAIIRACRTAALSVGAPVAARVVAVTFEPLPAAVLRPERPEARLTNEHRRQELLIEAGADAVITLETKTSLLEVEAEAFIAEVIGRLRPRAFVEGPDFYFGRNRGGNLEKLRAICLPQGIKVVEVPPVPFDPAVGSIRRISSTAIRALIREGNVQQAALGLGRPHAVTGLVARGDGRGAGIGFPTANLSQLCELLPAEGVYAGIATQLPSNENIRVIAPRAAAVNIGKQPTFGGEQPRVEAHLIDHAGDLYGQSLRIELLQRIRGVVKFDGVESLVAQIRSDVEATRRIVAESPHFARLGAGANG